MRYNVRCGADGQYVMSGYGRPDSPGSSNYEAGFVKFFSAFASRVPTFVVWRSTNGRYCLANARHAFALSSIKTLSNPRAIRR